MIITCPNCQTRYQLPPTSLGDRGRTVRCSSCGHRWFFEPPRDLLPRPVAAAGPEVERAPPPLLPATPLATPPPDTHKPKPAGGMTGWLLLALLVLLLTAAVLGRNEIATAFPAALPLYERLGLPVTVSLGLEFSGLASARRGGDNGATSVVVSGEIRNVSDREVRVPKLRVALLDDRHQEVQSGLFDAPQAVLPTSGKVPFEVELANPPEQARDFTITFADRP